MTNQGHASPVVADASGGGSHPLVNNSREKRHPARGKQGGNESGAAAFSSTRGRTPLT